MTVDNAFELATDALFRELSNFATPPRAGRITAVEGSGQVRVDTDDPDGGDVLAWPLNDFTYAVDDVVYVQFGVNSPDSAIVVGSKGATPTLSTYIRRSGVDTLTGNWDIGEDRRILAEAFRARDGEGLRLEDDAGNLGLMVEDGGTIIIKDTIVLSADNTIGVFAGGTSPEDAAFIQMTGVSMASDGSRGNFAIYGNTKNSSNGGLITFTQYDGVSTFTNVGRFTRSRQFLVGSHTSGSALLDVSQVLTTGSGLRVIRDLGSASTDSPLVTFIQDNTGDDQVLLRGQQDGTGDILNLFDGATEVLTLLDGGNFGLNVIAPQGRFHAFDGTGGAALITKTGVVGSSVVMIPNGTGDVTKACYMVGVITNSTPTYFAVANKVDNGSNQIFDDGGGNRLVITCNANGELSAARTVGTATWALTLWCVWQ